MPLKKFNNKLENCKCVSISSLVKETINVITNNHTLPMCHQNNGVIENYILILILK